MRRMTGHHSNPLPRQCGRVEGREKLLDESFANGSFIAEARRKDRYRQFPFSYRADSIIGSYLDSVE